MALLHTSPRANDRRVNLLLGFSAAVALVVVVLSVIVVPKILTSASTTAAIQRGNEIGGCRAAYRAQVDDAASRLQTSRARLDVATSEGLTAVAGNDDSALLAAVAKSGSARGAVIGDAERLARVTDRYADLIRLSREHPTRFLDLCRTEAP